MLSIQLIAWVAVLLTSILSSMVGIGGGTLYVPLLLMLGFPFHQVVTASLFTILMTSLSATLTYRHTMKVDWKLALWIEPPTFLMAFIGGYLSDRVDVRILKETLVVVLMGTAYLLSRPLHKGDRPPVRRGIHRLLADREYWVDLRTLMPATTLAGLLAGVEGISGGVLKVPAMVLLGGVPLDIAAATSELMVTVTAATGLLGHLLANRLDLAFALPLAVTASVGGQIGARLAAKVDRSVLQKVLVGMLVLAAGQLLWDTLGPGTWMQH